MNEQQNFPVFHLQMPVSDDDSSVETGEDSSKRSGMYGDDSQERKSKRRRTQRDRHGGEHEGMVFNVHMLMERHENLKKENEELKLLLLSATNGDDFPTKHRPIPAPPLPPKEVDPYTDPFVLNLYYQNGIYLLQQLLLELNSIHKRQLELVKLRLETSLELPNSSPVMNLSGHDIDS